MSERTCYNSQDLRNLVISLGQNSEKRRILKEYILTCLDEIDGGDFSIEEIERIVAKKKERLSGNTVKGKLFRGLKKLFEE